MRQGRAGGGRGCRLLLAAPRRGRDSRCAGLGGAAATAGRGVAGGRGGWPRVMLTGVGGVEQLNGVVLKLGGTVVTHPTEKSARNSSLTRSPALLARAAEIRRLNGVFLSLNESTMGTRGIHLLDHFSPHVVSRLRLPRVVTLRLKRWPQDVP